MSKLSRFYCDLQFGRALRRFRENPAAAINRENDVIDALIATWANQRWSALDEFLVACLGEALACKDPILECGSGLTTVLLGAVAQGSGGQVWSLEHSEKWGRRTAKYLKKYRLESVHFNTSPLKDYGDFSWYDPPVEEMPQRFGLVVCDGPPTETPGGRYGLMPVMAKRLSPNCVILVDDAGREAEKSMAEKWQREFGIELQMMGANKPYFHLKASEAGH